VREEAERAPACASASAAELAWIPGGTTLLGSDLFQPEEQPVRRAEVEEFWIDRHEVTNDQFAEFVRRTGYVTDGERNRSGRRGLRPGRLAGRSERDLAQLPDKSLDLQQSRFARSKSL
jgi:formylglycine-generating enzyme required for sulfatase activity